jgi:Tfp pilus assembly protein PilF
MVMITAKVKFIFFLSQIHNNFCRRTEAKANKEEITELLLQCRLNMGMVYLKMNMDIEAKEICTKVLEHHPNNEKALFRRGQVRSNFFAELNMN